MRHTTFHLDNAQIETAEQATLALQRANGRPVTFTYTKRDTGLVSEREGTVKSWHGAVMSSTGSVKMDTPSGERVFNLFLMTRVRPMGE